MRTQAQIRGISTIHGRMKAAPQGGGTPLRGLTRSSGPSREGLAMKATRPIELTESLRRRLATNVTRTEGGCLEWAGARNGNGYGSVGSVRDEHGRSIVYLAHRVAWTIANGPIPEGMSVCHTCDNPPCVNPDHLFIGTNQDNVDDMVSKGRMPHLTAANLGKTRCPQGHPYDGDNLTLYKGFRMCRTCKREQGRRKYHREREAAARGEFVTASPEVEAVAAVVNELLATGKPLEYAAVLKERLGVSRTRAQGLVKRARLAGLIPPAAGRRESPTCPNGHERSAENTYTKPDGTIVCRVCARKASAAYMRQRRARERAAREARQQKETLP